MTHCRLSMDQGCRLSMFLMRSDGGVGVGNGERGGGGRLRRGDFYFFKVSEFGVVLMFDVWLIFMRSMESN